MVVLYMAPKCEKCKARGAAGFRNILTGDALAMSGFTDMSRACEGFKSIFYCAQFGKAHNKKGTSMTFRESVKACFSKYADFGGRATRSEYWWFVLFMVLVSLAASIVSNMLSGLFHGDTAAIHCRSNTQTARHGPQRLVAAHRAGASDRLDCSSRVLGTRRQGIVRHTACNAQSSHHQRLFLHRLDLLFQHLHLALPVIAGTKPWEVDRKGGVVPAAG